MTDKEKLDAVRAEVQNYIYAARKAHTNITEGNFAHLLSFIDFLQEEPSSDDKITINKEWYEHCKKSWYNEGYIDGEYNRDRQFENSVSEELEKAAEEYAYTNWQSDDYHDGAAEGLPFDAIGHTQKTFKAGAKWKAEQFEKERLKQCDTLTKEQAQIESDFVVNFIRDHNCTPTFIDAIEYGMKIKLKDGNKL